jgi:hypothetical protein
LPPRASMGPAGSAIRPRRHMLHYPQFLHNFFALMRQIVHTHDTFLPYDAIVGR